MNGPADPQAEELANRGAGPGAADDHQPAGNIAAPTTASIVVEFYNNNTATIRVGNAQAAATILNAGEGGNPPYTAEGYSLSGNGDRVTINGKSCHT